MAEQWAGMVTHRPGVQPSLGQEQGSSCSQHYILREPWGQKLLNGLCGVMLWGLLTGLCPIGGGGTALYQSPTIQVIVGMPHNGTQPQSSSWGPGPALGVSGLGAGCLPHLPQELQLRLSVGGPRRPPGWGGPLHSPSGPGGLCFPAKH